MTAIRLLLFGRDINRSVSLYVRDIKFNAVVLPLKLESREYFSFHFSDWHDKSCSEERGRREDTYIGHFMLAEIEDSWYRTATLLNCHWSQMEYALHADLCSTTSHGLKAFKTITMVIDDGLRETEFASAMQAHQDDIWTGREVRLNFTLPAWHYGLEDMKAKRKVLQRLFDKILPVLRDWHKHGYKVEICITGLPSFSPGIIPSQFAELVAEVVRS